MDIRPPAPADPGPGRPSDDAPPPVPGGWATLYALVIGELLLVILFCGWLTTRGR